MAKKEPVTELVTAKMSMFNDHFDVSRHRRGGCFQFSLALCTACCSKKLESLAGQPPVWGLCPTPLDGNSNTSVSLSLLPFRLVAASTTTSDHTVAHGAQVASMRTVRGMQMSKAGRPAGAVVSRHATCARSDVRSRRIFFLSDLSLSCSATMAKYGSTSLNQRGDEHI